MASRDPLDYLNSFRKTYEPMDGSRFDHVTTVSHEGTMIVFVMEDLRIKYAVLGATDQVPNDADAWPESLQILDFPTELQLAGQEAIGNLIMPLTVEGEEYLPAALTPEAARKLDLFSSTTARLGGAHDFHVVSTDMHVYVFRQSVAKADPMNVVPRPEEDGVPSTLMAGNGNRQGLLDDTVLADRFVLVTSGDTATLQPMRESRYQRSRNKSLPAGRTDTLDQKDMNGKPFFEPTIALTMIPPVGAGGFCALTIPSENGNGRWQIFTHNANAKEIEGFSIARNEMGGFDFQGERFYTSPDPQYRPAVLERRPGKCPFTQLALVPLIKETLGEPRWVLRTPRTERFFAEQPIDKLSLTLPAFDTDGTSGMCIECWIKPESTLTLTLVSAGDEAGRNTKKLPKSAWSHLQANFLLLRAGDAWIKEIRIDIDESDRDPVFRRTTIAALPAPIDLLKEVLQLLTVDCRLSELRVFNLPRTAAMARDDRHYQLRGDESYLVAYYPLAGGSDLTLQNHAAHVMVPGVAITGYPDVVPAVANAASTWILDNPPLHENPGVNRRSLMVVDGVVLVGLSCLLYHEQIAERTDLSDLARGDVRVMLAVTQSFDPAAPGNVTVLDWNVTAAGRLARAKPLRLSSLAALRPVALQPAQNALDRLKARKAELQASIDRLVATEEVVPHPSGSLAGVGGLDATSAIVQPVGGVSIPHPAAGDAGFASHLAEFAAHQPTGLPTHAFGVDLAALQGSIGGRSATIVAQAPSADEDTTEETQFPTLAAQRERLAQYRQELEQIERSIRDLSRLGTDELHALSPEYSGAYRESIPMAGTDGLGCILRAGRLAFASTPHRATLFDAAGGSVLLYFAQRLGDHSEVASATYDVKAARHVIEHDIETTDGRHGTLSLGSHQSDALSSYTTSRIQIVQGATDVPATITLQVSNAVLGIEETWRGIPNSFLLVADVVNGEPLPSGCSKVVRLHGDDFVDSLDSFPSRLVVARLKLEGSAQVSLSGVSGAIAHAGIAPAWSSEPAGYSFSPLKRFVASLKDPSALKKLRGDRALTLESWVFPFAEDDDSASSYERVLWMKDAEVAGSTRIFNYGIALSSRVTEHLLHAENGFLSYAPSTLPGKAFVLGSQARMTIDRLTEVPAATIETLVKFEGEVRDGIFLTLSHLRLEIDSGMLTCQEFGGDEARNTTLRAIVSGQWYHCAIVIDGTRASVLIDGEERVQVTSSISQTKTVRFMPGGNRLHVAEFRFWEVKRSISQIRALKDLALNGEAPRLDRLCAYLPPAGIQTASGSVGGKNMRIRNYANNEDYVITADALEFSPSPFRTVRYVFDDVRRQSIIGLRHQCWSHIAVRYAHAFGLQLRPDLHIEQDTAGAAVDRDLTIEMALQWNGKAATLLTQAIEGDAGEHAFGLGIEADGHLVFFYSAMNGSSISNPTVSSTRNQYLYRSASSLAQARFQTLAVRRWSRKVKISEYSDGSAYGDKNEFHESHREEEVVTIDFFVEGVASGSFTVNDPVHVYKRADGEEVPLYPRAGATIEDLAREAKEAKSPSTTMSVPTGKAPFYAPKVDGTALPMVIGGGFDGVLYEVRLWSSKCVIGRTWSQPQAALSALRHWWRFEDGRGARVTDARDPQAVWATLQDTEEAAGLWVRSEDPESHFSSLCLNGVPLSTRADDDTTPRPVDLGFSLGKNFFGLIDEVRIWNGVRTEEAIRDHLFVKVQDELENLIAYYPFNLDPAGEVHDEGPANLDLTVSETAAPKARSRRGTGGAARTAWTPDHHSLNDGPARHEIGMVRTVLSPFHNRFVRTASSAVFAQEYSDMQMDADGGVAGAYKRAYAFLEEGALHLITGFKVGSLTSEWVSQVQYDPQLIGYIEGAPPVPGENLTLGPKTLKMDYNGVSSIELVDAVTDKYTFSQSREIAEKSSTEVEATYNNNYGIKDFVIAPFGVGLTFKGVVNFGGGYKGKYETSNGMIAKNGVIAERESKKTTKFQVNGHWQSAKIDKDLAIGDHTDSDPKSGYNKTLGLRFIPENKGLALVKSKVADVFALRLRGHKGIMAYRMLPNPDIPEDFNLMTFDINPKYTKQGTLDGRLGLDGNDTEGFKAFFDPDYRYMSQEDWNFAYDDPYGKTNLPGKVDAYRFSTFFLDGKESHHDDFFEKVVDPTWLSQSSDPDAAALRPLKARSTKSRPWRILHRVTFVSRILPLTTKADVDSVDTVEQAMTASQIKSNYELVNMLEPLLGGATGTVRSLRNRLHQVLPRFPLLLPFEREIRDMLVLYYGIPEHTQ